MSKTLLFDEVKKWRKCEEAEENYEPQIDEVRVGLCRHTNCSVLQCYDGFSDDAKDETGWLCLHDETIEQEVFNILKFTKEKYGAEIFR